MRILTISLLVLSLSAAPVVAAVTVSKTVTVKTKTKTVTVKQTVSVKPNKQVAPKRSVTPTSHFVQKATKMPKFQKTLNVVNGHAGAAFPFPPHPPVVIPEPVVRAAPDFDNITDYMSYLRNKHSKGKAN